MITEYFRSERSHVYPPANGRLIFWDHTVLLQTLSSHIWKTFDDGNSRVSLANLLHSLALLMVKKLFLTSILKFSSLHLCLLSLILLPCTTVKSLVPSTSQLHMGNTPPWGLLSDPPKQCLSKTEPVLVPQFLLTGQVLQVWTSLRHIRAFSIELCPTKAVSNSLQPVALKGVSSSQGKDLRSEFIDPPSGLSTVTGRDGRYS